jgi:Flp pilus assembly protein TadG
MRARLSPLDLRFSLPSQWFPHLRGGSSWCPGTTGEDRHVLLNGRGGSSLTRAGRTIRSRHGAAALEFALVGALLFCFLIGILEVGRYMITLEAVRTVTAEAVRVATLRGSANLNDGGVPCQSLSGSLAGAVDTGPILAPGSLTIGLSGCTTQGGMTSVTVTVTYPFTSAIPLIATSTRSLQDQGVAMIF